MAGHNRWTQIKRAKGAADARRGKVFSKLARELIVAAKEGGGDPAHNAELLALRQSSLRLTQRMNDGDMPVPDEKLGEFQARLFTEVRETFDAIRRPDTRAPLRVEDLPAALRDRPLAASDLSEAGRMGARASG